MKHKQTRGQIANCERERGKLLGNALCGSNIRWYFLFMQCLGSVTFWCGCGSGSVPLIQLRIRLLSSGCPKKCFPIFSSYNLPACTLWEKGRIRIQSRIRSRIQVQTSEQRIRIKKAQKHADPDPALDLQHWFSAIFGKKYCLLWRRIAGVKKNLFRKGNTVEEAHGFFSLVKFGSNVALPSAFKGRLHREKKDWERGMESRYTRGQIIW